MRRPSLLLLLLALTGCKLGTVTQGEDGGQTRPLDGGPTRDAGVSPDAGASTDAGLALPCAANATLACACTGSIGTLRCSPDGRAWSTCRCEGAAVELAVSPSGDDQAAGTIAAPFRTLQRAQSAVQTLLATADLAGGVRVWIRGGTYALGAPLSFGPRDSSSDGGWVTWRGYPGEVATLSGGKQLDPSAFAEVTAASAVWSRIDPGAQGQVLALSLPAQGITDTGSLVPRGFDGDAPAALELSLDGQVLPLARWPDADENPNPRPTLEAPAVDLFGAGLSPNVSGHYLRSAAQDGVPSFERVGLVGGLQYRLYRYSGSYQGNAFTGWYLTTSAAGYPSNAAPWWASYGGAFTDLAPQNGATGTVTFTSPSGITAGMARIASVQSGSRFTVAFDRPARWGRATEVWLHGLWKYDWADLHVRATAIDPVARTIDISPAPGFGIAPGQPFYAENLLEELTEPGEWWVDRTTGMLYLWPPAPLQSHTLVVSTLAAPLVRFDGASSIALEDLTLISGRSSQVKVDASTHLRFRGLTLRGAGTSAMEISGTDVGVEHALVIGPGSSGIVLVGGDRPSLTAGSNFVEDSELRDFGRWSWTYRPAIDLQGVGQRASHNRIHGRPHAGLLYGGNEHLIELNEVFDVCRYADDSGAIYAGRDWGARGIVIRHNFIHGLHSALSPFVHAIYLDDCLSGVRVEGNIIHDVSGFGVLHGGGRDDLVVNNVFSRTGTGFFSDSRCIDWLSTGVPNHTAGDSFDLLGKLESEHYQQPPWSVRYPACAAIPDDWAVITAPDSGWLAPGGSVFARNVGTDNARFAVETGSDDFHAFAAVGPNLPDAGALFVDPDAGDFRVAPGSGAFAVPGFQDIPTADIGIRP